MTIRIHSALAVAAAALVLAAACGGDDSSLDEAAATDTTAPGGAAGNAVAASVGDTPLGQILVGEDGMTLYGFTNDVDGTSTCTGTCAEAWPPVVVGPDWSLGPGLDTGVFSTVRRDDGSEQLVAGRWPLYYYAGDSAPGDVNGQGAGEVWYAVALDATLIEDDVPAGADAASGDESVRVSGSALGEILVDGGGHTLYAFTEDGDGVPTCTGDCAATWPAHVVDGDPVLAEGLDPEVFTLVAGAEGGQQLVAGNWPLYRFSGDASPGDVDGQGSGGVWFAVAEDGSLVDAPPVDGSADDPPGVSGGGSAGGGSGGY
jgi:predicted lipoprotein with Yx(FWY)xxD motif